MATTNSTPKTKQAEPGNDAVPTEAVHDNIQMASVKADGSLDQVNPVFIGDKDATLAATKEQFKQQAVSAADAQRSPGGTTVEDAPQDPSIAAAQAEHEKVAVQAEKAAEAVVESHFQD